MHCIKAHSLIELIRMIFATHGIPQNIVSDNGPTFTSQEFNRTFMNQKCKCKPYFSRKGELSVLDGCILWGTRAQQKPARFKKA